MRIAKLSDSVLEVILPNERLYLRNSAAVVERLFLNASLFQHGRSVQLWKLPNYKTPFRNRGVQQTKSPLFQNLPAEIRLSIYRVVLKHDAFVTLDPARARSDGTIAFLRGTYGLLTLCQEILDEAIPVFYDENTFSISFGSDGTYSIMRCHFKLPADFHMCGVITESLLDNSRIVPAFLQSLQVNTWNETRKLTKRFNSFVIDFSSADPFKIYLACCSLGEHILSSKKVTAILPLGDVTGLEVAKNAHRIKVLKACQGLRCRKLMLSKDKAPKRLTRLVEGPH